MPPATDQVISLGFVTHRPCDLGSLTDCDEPQFPFSTKSGLKPTSENHWERPPQMPTLARAGWIRVECTTVKGENDLVIRYPAAFP